MNSKLSSSSKVGIFALIAIGVILYLTMRVSDFKLSPTGTYSVYLDMKSAEGIDHKTPVMIAGIQVGVVESIDLTDLNHARVKLKIRKGVELPKDVRVEIHTKGVLGDTFLELIPGQAVEKLGSGETIQNVKPYTDFNELTRNLNDVALNLKDISGSIKKYVTTDDSEFAHIMKNMEKLTNNLAGFAGNNRQNMDMIVANLRDLTHDLKGMVRENSGEINDTLKRLDSITQKIDQGKGTIGKLINDPATGEKINETLDSVNDLVTPISKLQIELGYHLEYLTTTHDTKNYVSLALKPRPDKYFLLEFVSDPNPAPSRTTTTTQVTTNGVTSTVTTDREEVNHGKFRLSAEFAKKFYDFTFRAGLIESSGGVGIDYNKGPFGVQFSAFNFGNSANERPHLKAMATVNLTKGFYVLGGADDFISKQHGPDFFFGAGIRFLDEDIKSLLGAFAFKP